DLDPTPAESHRQDRTEIDSAGTVRPPPATVHTRYATVRRSRPHFAASRSDPQHRDQFSDDDHWLLDSRTGRASARSYRSRFMTLFHAATKSVTNFSRASSQA